MIRRLLLLALSAGPIGAAGQTPPALERVDSLIAVGRAEEARTVLSGWWGLRRAPVDRAQTQHAVWLRAVLTVDPAQAAVDYQRLVVEYPGGPYTDRALLRLAQSAEARGDAGKAREHLRSLLRDYPSSMVRADAERLLQSVEPAAQARVQARAAPPPADPASTPPSATAPDSVVLPRAIAGSWTVQLGAFASPGGARALAAAVAAGGNEVRIVIVPPSRLIRVRTGRFLSQGAADGLRGTLVARGLEATVVGDADREETAK